MIDWRTHITGLDEEAVNAQGVPRAEAVRAVRKLLEGEESADSEGEVPTIVPTIVVGHSLHHDLRALRLRHSPRFLVDTAMLFNIPSG